MKLYDLFGAWLCRPTPTRPPASRRRGLRPRLERLEDRTVPVAFTATNVAELIADINSANQNSEADTITLAAGTTFTLTAPNNGTEGATGLPVIAAGSTVNVI